MGAGFYQASCDLNALTLPFINLQDVLAIFSF
jgi:hypothetical protein